MAKLYWNTDRTQQTTSANARELYEKFVSQVIGLPYTELKEKAKEIYEKETEYFSTLSTPLNFLGFLQTTENETRIIIKNDFLDRNIRNVQFSELYTDYFLSYWQYPRHNNSDDRDISIRKPYLLIIKLLKLLFDINPEEAYLTDKEFFYLFSKDIQPLKTYDDINLTLINQILDNNRSWGREQNDLPTNSILNYEKALLKNSTLISFNQADYNNINDFSFGLKKETNTMEKVKWILSDYLRNDVFVFDPTRSERDKDVINDWANFITNEERFNRWFKAMSISEFSEYCSMEGYQFDNDLVRRFILSLETKPFLLLTGISGSGKTKIAEHYGNYLESKARGEKYILAVGSNWNDGKKLLGFNNPLQPDAEQAYLETDLVKFIKNANENTDKTFIVILDEMNLSYTEKYFSDFLSALESLDNKIKLPNGENITWSKNIKIIGTINEDETTHTISPKILDRANVIEMNGLAPSVYIAKQMASPDDNIYKDFTRYFDIKEYKSILDKIYNALNGNFAFRIIDEITLYIKINKEYNAAADLHMLLDEQVYQKLLPKIHGSKLDLPKKLNELKSVLYGTEKEYLLTNTKITKMLDHVSTHGYASFIMG